MINIVCSDSSTWFQSLSISSNEHQFLHNVYDVLGSRIRFANGCNQSDDNIAIRIELIKNCMLSNDYVYERIECIDDIKKRTRTKMISTAQWHALRKQWYHSGFEIDWFLCPCVCAEIGIENYLVLSAIEPFSLFHIDNRNLWTLCETTKTTTNLELLRSKAGKMRRLEK